MNDTTADLDTEVRRLRVRIIGLTPAQLAEAGETSVLPRREAIAEALAEFSRIGSGARPVPDIGEQSLSDQVVVLLETGLGRANALEPESREQLLDCLLEAAVELRRELA